MPKLLDAGYRVRVMARNPRRLSDREWFERVEVAEADAGQHDEVAAALDGVDVAYYLIHALGTGRRFASKDRHTARTFSSAARDAGVGRLVYLGGLHPEHEELSDHLDSRREVGEILLASGVPTTALQAAVIIGSGSASFEMLRYLTERLPVMVTPRWVRTNIQPIAVRDVLHYLVGSASMPPEVNRTFDIGGPDVADVQGDDGRVRPRGRAPAAADRAGARAHAPAVEPLGAGRDAGPQLDRATARRLAGPRGRLLRARHRRLRARPGRRAHRASPRHSSWRSPGSRSSRSTPRGVRRRPPAPRATRCRATRTGPAARCTSTTGRPSSQAAPEHLWSVIEGIGGQHGWYSWSFGWRIRGLLDRSPAGRG